MSGLGVGVCSVNAVLFYLILPHICMAHCLAHCMAHCMAHCTSCSCGFCVSKWQVVTAQWPKNNKMVQKKDEITPHKKIQCLVPCTHKGLWSLT